jgi:hypothetical protein
LKGKKANMKTRKTKKSNRKKVAPVESVKAFRLRIAKKMNGEAAKSKLPPEIDARLSPNRASAAVLRNAKKKVKAKRTTIQAPAEPEVHILNARSELPIWQFTSGKLRIELWPNRATDTFTVAVTDIKADRGVLIEMPFKAFRSLNHWGMPIAKKGKAK